MPEVLSEIEARLRACEDALDALVRRVGRLEDERAIASPTASGSDPDGPSPPRPVPVDYAGLVSLTGRTCVVLGGAFLVRALTESGRLPGVAGVGLGLAYAAMWFGAADRASRRRPISGLFHGLAGALIGFPLLWEASLRFHLLAPATGAMALAGLTCIGLGVARHRQLPVLAGVLTGGAVLTGLSLAFLSALLPHLIVLLMLTCVVWWMDDVRAWSWLKWPTAIAVNFIVLAIGARAGSASPLAPAATAYVVVTSTMWTVVATAAVRTVVQRRTVSAFDVACTLVTVTVGTMACLAVTPHVSALARDTVGWNLVMVGGLGYGVAAGVRSRDPDARSAFSWFSTLGLVALTSGVALALPAAARDLTLSLLAVGCGWLAIRSRGAVVAAHSAVLVVIVSITAGVLRALLQMWITGAGALPAFPGPGWFVLGTALMGGLLPRASTSRGLARVLSMSRLALAILVTMSVASVLLVVIAYVAGGPPSPGRLATLKTLTLSCTALALAVLRRQPYGAELGWLSSFVLVAGGVKLVVEDFRVSPPATLFIALAIFGTALILVSRLARAGRTPVS